jgi:2-aminobenzoylacetyl-CoA thioesterase
MRIRKPGRITDGLWLLGREEASVYLLEGKRESMIINGGMGHIVPDVLSQFDEFGIDESRIKKILILHSHFDHVGIAPFFKRRIEDLEVIGSSRAWELLSTPRSVATINRSSLETAFRFGREDAFSRYDLEWRDIKKGTSVYDGDAIDLGDMKGIIYETQGHSSCAISFYVPQLKALFPTDCLAIPFKDARLIAANSNYTKYQANLERLKTLDANFICADHYGCITGMEGRNYASDCIATASEFRDMMEEYYNRFGDLDLAVKEMATRFYAQNDDYFLPREITEGVYKQMMRHVTETANGK